MAIISITKGFCLIVTVTYIWKASKLFYYKSLNITYAIRWEVSRQLNTSKCCINEIFVTSLSKTNVFCAKCLYRSYRYVTVQTVLGSNGTDNSKKSIQMSPCIYCTHLNVNCEERSRPNQESGDLYSYSQTGPKKIHERRIFFREKNCLNMPLIKYSPIFMFYCSLHN